MTRVMSAWTVLGITAGIIVAAVVTVASLFIVCVAIKTVLRTAIRRWRDVHSTRSTELPTQMRVSPATERVHAFTAERGVVDNEWDNFVRYCTERETRS